MSGNSRSAAPSYSAGSIDVPLLEETIGENLRRGVTRWASADALIDLTQDVRYTYGEFDSAVDVLARALIGSQMLRGDRVGIWAPNCSEWVLLQYATARIGVILVNINPAYRAQELQYALEQSGCRMLFAVPEFKTSNYREAIDSVRADLHCLERAVFLNTDDWTQLLAAGSGQDGSLRKRESELSIDDPVNIQYTSGTTGFPKGATLTHRNILNNGYFVGEACRYTQNDRVCIPVPFYHCFGMVLGNLASLTHGAAIVIPSPSFEPAKTLSAVARERCTSLLGVPTMFVAELTLPDFSDYDLSSLRTGIMAGSPCPVEIMRRCIHEMHMTEVTICYGMTETSPVSTQTGTNDPIDKRVATVGRVHPHVEVKIINQESGSVVPRGEKGELCTRGYSVMLGYWNDESKTAEAIDPAGWMHTGDLATMDVDGYINIGGRIKDLIIRGGENIYPREIEEFLHTHPDIVDVQVIGVPDAYYGEEVMAWLIVRDGAKMDSAIVKDYCRESIAHYKIPRYVHVVKEFPLTITGKVRKIEMREQSIVLLKGINEKSVNENEANARN